MTQDTFEFTTSKKAVLVLRRPSLLDLTCAGLLLHALAIAFGDTQTSDPSFPGISEEDRLFQALIEEEGEEGDISQELTVLTAQLMVDARTPAGTQLDKTDWPVLIAGFETPDFDRVYNWAMTRLESQFKYFANHESAKLVCGAAQKFHQWPSDLLAQPSELALLNLKLYLLTLEKSTPVQPQDPLNVPEFEAGIM